MFIASSSAARRFLIVALAAFMLASCSGDPVSAERKLGADGSVGTVQMANGDIVIPQSNTTVTADGLVESSQGVGQTDEPQSGAAAIACSGVEPGESFTVPFTPQPAASLDLIVEVRDQARSADQPDLVRSWPVTVTVSDQTDGNQWLMVWEATRSSLELPVGFSSSDANDLQARGLPPMPPAFYRTSGDGNFLRMEIPDGFGRAVAQGVTAAAEEADPATKQALDQLAALYTGASPDTFVVALTEAEIFHEFATATFSANAETVEGSARASAFLLDPVTTSITQQLEAGVDENGCAVVTKLWSVTPEQRNEEPGRPVVEVLYVGKFDSVSGQPSEIVQTVTLVRDGDGQELATRRQFTTTLTVTRPWG